MNVYFTAPVRFNSDLTTTYKKIINHIKRKKLNLVSGEQIVKKPLLKKDVKLTPQEIFHREMNLLNQADVVVAEITRPSLGVGSEIQYFLSQNKPVIALVDINYTDKISAIIAGNPSPFLFLEFYSDKNLYQKIDKYLDSFSEIKKMKNLRGKFIVIDGSDGSGKKTQAELLIKTFQSLDIPVKFMDFPRYYDSFHGKTVAQFLRGEFGSINQVSPYLASLAYALDRVSAKKEMEDFLSIGGYIVANRYATSNMAHQGAKFKTLVEKEKFLKWLNELEYIVHKIPKEDIVIYLDVPLAISNKLTEKKSKRAYLNGKSRDIHEADLQHLQDAENMYRYLLKKHKHWIRIECTQKNAILPIEVIQKKIVNELKRKNIIE